MTALLQEDLRTPSSKVVGSKIVPDAPIVPVVETYILIQAGGGVDAAIVNVNNSVVVQLVSVFVTVHSKVYVPGAVYIVIG